jgi:hypothetical protein
MGATTAAAAAPAPDGIDPGMVAEEQEADHALVGGE